MAARLTLDFETPTVSAIFGITVPYRRVETPSSKISSIRDPVPARSCMASYAGTGTSAPLPPRLFRSRGFYTCSFRSFR